MSAPTATIAPRASHKVPEQVIKDVLAKVRERFYPRAHDPAALKAFCRDRDLLMRAVTYPAAFLRQRMGDGVPLPWDQYEQILGIVMSTIERQGNVEKIAHFAGYFLKCVQTHMPHNWERYETAAKNMRHVFSIVLLATVAGERPVMDSTVDELARMHDALKIKGGRKPAAKPNPAVMEAAQQELF